MSKLPIRFRPATSEDANFIFNSWLKSYRHSAFARGIENQIYYAEQHKLLEKAIKNYKTIIACNKDDTSQIFGYINGGLTDGILTINYIYTKHSFRNMGIGKALLNVSEHDPSHAAIYTMHTRIADKLAPKYNLVYHPYVLFNDYPKAEQEIENEEK